MRAACIVAGLKVKGYPPAPVSCTISRVESRFQIFSSALPLDVVSKVRFTSVALSDVRASVIRTIRFPKSGSLTIVFAPTSLPTFGNGEGMGTMSRSVREQYTGGPQAADDVTRSERLCWAVCEAESLPCTVKLKVPVCVGEPDNVPVLELSCNPAGSEPEAMLH